MNKETILQNLESLVLCLALFILCAFLDRYVKEDNKVFAVIGLAFIFLGGFFFLNIVLLLIDLLCI